MTHPTCHVCTGRLAHVEHGIPCTVCLRRVCGNCYKAIRVPHVAAGHESGVAVCLECLRITEAETHIDMLRRHHKQYLGLVSRTLDLWKFHAAEEREARDGTQAIDRRPTQ